MPHVTATVLGRALAAGVLCIGLWPSAAAGQTLIAHWRGDGDALEATGSHHGAPQGSVAHAPGRDGPAFSLDGSSWVQVPDHPALDLTTGLTVAAWIKPGIGTARLVDKAVSGTGNGWVLDLLNGRLRLVAGETGLAISYTHLPAGAWRHVAASWDGTTIRLYIDGVLDRSEPSAQSTHPPSGTPLRIGASSLNTCRYQGLIDDVRVYGGALPPGAIADLAGAGNPSPRPCLAAGGAGASSLILGWEAVPEATHYRVERRKRGSRGPFSLLGRVPAGTTAFVDAGAVGTTGYEYRVVALKAAGAAGPADRLQLTFGGAPPSW